GGVGPLPIRIAKHRPDVRATAIELNPYAHNYCVENIHLNRVGDRVEAILGDVREVAGSLDRRYDRILMPLPKGAYMFLDVAVPLLQDGGVLHFYHWAPSEDMYGEAEELVKAAFREEGREAVVTDRVRVSQYSPRYWKVRIDAEG
nr:class I SAM-dependent methyltransferase family protein [Candidatus Bathyarchaeota archaeon]